MTSRSRWRETLDCTCSIAPGVWRSCVLALVLGVIVAVDALVQRWTTHDAAVTPWIGAVGVALVTALCARRLHRARRIRWTVAIDAHGRCQRVGDAGGPIDVAWVHGAWVMLHDRRRRERLLVGPGSVAPQSLRVLRAYAYWVIDAAPIPDADRPSAFVQDKPG